MVYLQFVLVSPVQRSISVICIHIATLFQILSHIATTEYYWIEFPVLSILYLFYACCSCCCCLVTKLCLALCDPMDCNLPGLSVHWISQARILECFHFFLQVIFLNQVSNPHLLHQQANSSLLSHQGSFLFYIQ